MSSTTFLRTNKPFLIMNHYYVATLNDVRVKSEAISGLAFENGRFKRDAVIIDADCRKFLVIGAIKTGWSKAWGGTDLFFNLFYPPAKRRYQFEFLVGEPEQLTFEQAREEIVEHICNRRWASHAGGSPANFHKLQAAKTNIVDVMNSIGFLGKDPF